MNEDRAKHYNRHLYMRCANVNIIFRSTPNIVSGGSSVHPSLLRDDSLEGEKEAPEDEVVANKPEMELTSYIRQNITGGAKTFQGPFGRKQVVQKLGNERQTLINATFLFSWFPATLSTAAVP
jgi:hypothetical protein